MRMSSSTRNKSRVDRQVELAIPLWIVGERRPVDRERRKDPGDLSRHIQQRKGIAPPSSLRCRRVELPPLPERVIELWRAGS